MSVDSGAERLVGTPDAPETSSPPAGSSKGMRAAGASFIATVVLTLASSVVVARLYGVEVVGEFALASAPWFLQMQVSGLSEHVGMIQRLTVLGPRNRAATGLVAVTFAFSAAFATLTGLLVALGTVVVLRGPVGQPDLVWPALTLLAGYVVLDKLSFNVDMVLSAYQAGRELFWARLVQLLGYLVAAVIGVAVAVDVWTLVVATLIGMVVGLGVRLALLTAFLLWRTTGRDLREGARQVPGMIRFGLRILPGNIASSLSTQAGTWVLGVTSSVAVVGAYARASGLASRILDAGYRVCEMLFPTLVRHHEAGDVAGFHAVMVQVRRWVTAFLFLIAATGSGASTGVLRVFGPGFDEAAGALSLLLFAFSVNVVIMLQGQAFTAVGRPGVPTAWGIGRAVLVFATIVPAARWAGATGVAAVFLAAMVLELVLKDVVSRHGELAAVRDPVFLRTTVATLVASAAGGLTAWSCELVLSPLWALPVGLPLGIAAYVVVFLLLGGATAQERASVLSRFRH